MSAEKDPYRFIGAGLQNKLNKPGTQGGHTNKTEVKENQNDQGLPGRKRSTVLVNGKFHNIEQEEPGGSSDRWLRQTYLLDAKDHIEKLQAYAYWERLHVSEAMRMILDKFFEGKKIKDLPDAKKKR